MASTKRPVIADLPLQDQLALRFLGYMLMGGERPPVGDGIAAANAYAAEFLDRARERWRQANGRADADAADDDETADEKGE